MMYWSLATVLMITSCSTQMLDDVLEEGFHVMLCYGVPSTHPSAP
jgi:hypothetical protein